MFCICAVKICHILAFTQTDHYPSSGIKPWSRTLITGVFHHLPDRGKGSWIAPYRGILLNSVEVC